MQTFKRGNPIAAERRLFFEAVSADDLQLRLADLAAFTTNVLKPGAADTLPAAGTPTQVNSTTMEGVYYLQLSIGEIDTVGSGVSRFEHAGMEPRSVGYLVEEAIFGTVAAGSLSPSAFTTNRGEVDNHWKNGLVRFITGALAGQVKKIGAFTNSGGLIALDTGLVFTAAPLIGDFFEILTA
jgi:hypothetical protein